MSLIATRMPLDTIAMNRVPKSPDVRRPYATNNAQDEEELARKTTNAGIRAMSETTGPTQDERNEAVNNRAKRKQAYDRETDGFVFTKNKRAKPSQEPAVRSATKDGSFALEQQGQRHENVIVTAQVLREETSNEATRKVRRRLPVTPDRETSRKILRQEGNARLSPSSHKAAHAQSHANTARIPSPAKAITVEKKRRKHDNVNSEEEHTARILLPASDTPVIRRNKAMRQSVANSERRRSSSGMRGRRASDMIDEGRWNAQPHSEVKESEFYTMISPDLTEPRRMRLLLGWCGDRALPRKPQAPSDSSKKASEEFQAVQAARVIQEELSKELSSNAALSEWFSRDVEAPQPAIVLRKKPNPRNIANAAKIEELEKELQRLISEQQAWDSLMSEAAHSLDASISNVERADINAARSLSPPRFELLSPSQQEVLEQFQRLEPETQLDAEGIQQRLKSVSSGMEFIVDQFANSVHAIDVANDVARRMAERSLKDAAEDLDQRDQTLARATPGPRIDALDALKGLARILNTRR